MHYWPLSRSGHDARKQPPPLLNGSLEREEIPGRVKVYIAELNKLYPTQYRKFGDSLLVSLDEVLFEDGSTTRGDTVSRGLWD